LHETCIVFLNNIISGAYFGMIGEIIFFRKQYEGQFSDIKTIMTGGFLRYFEKDIKNHIFAHPYLTLIGLNIILNLQDEK
jgi:pantothenate kinase type III